MITATLFFCSLGLVIVAAALTMRAGYRRQRHLHLRLAIATVVIFAVSIGIAYRLGQLYAFPEREMAVHFVFSRSGAALLVLVAVSGVLLWRNAKWRGVHRLCVWLFVLATLAAFGTGVWAFALAVPK